MLLASDRLGDRTLPAPTVHWPSAGLLPELRIDSGEPRRPFLVLVSEEGGVLPVVLNGLEVPVFDDALFQASLLSPGLFGTTDASGAARVDLAPLAPDPAAQRGKRLLAAYVIYQSLEHPLVRAVSGAVAFTIP